MHLWLGLAVKRRVEQDAQRLSLQQETLQSHL